METEQPEISEEALKSYIPEGDPEEQDVEK